ncbi:MAG: hypothetical protein L3J63_05660 [Geopsychrobacter sp.]|nr:hypothetical protein [Geopsychrobacter sp.]
MKHCLLWALLLCLIPLQAFALDWSKIRLNGFVSQGYLASSDNNFLADTTDGTFQYNEIGLTVNTQVSDKLRVGVQLLARDLGEVGNNEIRLDWGYGDYRFTDYFGVRIGKVKLPLGLYNEGRDSDFLRSMVFLPQSIYNENQRDMLVAYQGLGIYGNLPLETAGDLDYHVFFGTTNMPSDALMFKTVRNSFNRISTGLGGQQVTSVAEDDSIYYGGALVYNTALDGLRLGASYLSSENNFKATLANGSHADGRLEIDNHFVLSLEYIREYFGLMTEYMEMTSSQNFLGVTTAEKNPQAWYIMLHWFATDQLTFSALYDIRYADKNDKNGNSFVAMGMPDFLAWRKDASLGVRYDATENWTLKAEFHQIDGNELFTTVIDTAATLEKNWNYFALKATFNF